MDIQGGQISPEEQRFYTSKPVLVSIAGDPTSTGPYPSKLFVLDSGGTLYALRVTTAAPTLAWSAHQHGFTNSGPAVDDRYVYLPMRWLAQPNERDGDADNPTADYGGVAAYSKADGALQWTHSFADLGTQAKKAWVNIAPIVAGGGTGADGEPKRRAVLVGLTSGEVVALDGDGRRLPAFTTADGYPVACAELENPGSRAAGNLSDRVALSSTPLFDTSETWSNASGVASGLMFARERLLTGVNEASGRSQLVALRMGTNVAITGVQLEQDGRTFTPNGEGAVEQIDPTRAFAAHVTVNWFVPGGGRNTGDVPMLFGWAEEGPEPVVWVAPPPPGEAKSTTVTIQMKPRTGGRPAGTLLAMVNPGLYYRRYTPAAPQSGIAAEAVPTAWNSVVQGFAGAAGGAHPLTVGEVEIVDNWYAFTAGPTRPVVTLQMPAAACIGDAVAYETTYEDPRGLALAAQEPAQWPLAAYDEAGRYTFTYRAQNDKGEWSDSSTATVQVKDCSAPDEPVQWFRVSFTPDPALRGDRIQTGITVLQPEAIAGRPLVGFSVDRVSVFLPAELQHLTNQVDPNSLAVWREENTETEAAGGDLDWTYAFALPAPSSDPPDGPYPIEVRGSGEYRYEEVEHKSVCPPPGVPGACQLVETRQEKSAPWSATEEKVFRIEGGHEYVHPITDYGN